MFGFTRGVPPVGVIVPLLSSALSLSFNNLSEFALSTSALGVFFSFWDFLISGFRLEFKLLPSPRLLVTLDWLFISIHFDTTYVYLEVSLFVHIHSDISYLTDSGRPIGPSCMRLPNVFLAVKMADFKSITHSPKIQSSFSPYR